MTSRGSARIPRSRQVRFTLTEFAGHTVLTVTTRDGRDEFEWDRRRGTVDVPTGEDALNPRNVAALRDALAAMLLDL